MRGDSLPGANTPLTFSEISWPAIVEYVTQELQPLRARIAAMEAHDLAEIESGLVAPDGLALVVADRIERTQGAEPPKSDTLTRAECFYHSLADRLRLCVRDALGDGNVAAADRAGKLLRCAMFHTEGGPRAVADALIAAGVLVPISRDDQPQSKRELSMQRFTLDRQVAAARVAINGSKNGYSCTGSEKIVTKIQ